MRETFALLIIAAVFGILRFVVPVEGVIAKEDVFKDLAHCYVGGLFGAAILATKRTFSGMETRDYRIVFAIVEAVMAEWVLWSLAVGLTVLEIVAFVVRKQ